MRYGRFSIGRLFLILLATFVVFLVVDNPKPIADGYGKWGAAEMVVQYMKAHDGQWPQNWEELSPYVETYGRSPGWTLKDFEQRIVVDFDVDVDELQRQAVASETVPFDVIYARSKLAGVVYADPNSIIHYYLRKQAGIVEAPGKWPSHRQKQVADEWWGRGFYVRFNSRGEMSAAWPVMGAPVIRPGDNEISHLKNYPHVRLLNVVGGHVTDDGLAVVQKLPNLEELDLYEGITDKVIDHLAGHPSLASIDLFGSEITDEGVRRLGKLPKLRSLRYDKSRISDDAIKDLKKAVPNLEIRPEGELRAPM